MMKTKAVLFTVHYRFVFFKKMKFTFVNKQEKNSEFFNGRRIRISSESFFSKVIFDIRNKFVREILS